MIRFHKSLPPDVHAQILQKIREVVGEPHAFDERHFLLETMPDRKTKEGVELFQMVGYLEGVRGTYAVYIDLEYHQDLAVLLSDGNVHTRRAGKWKNHGNI